MPRPWPCWIAVGHRGRLPSSRPAVGGRSGMRSDAGCTGMAVESGRWRRAVRSGAFLASGSPHATQRDAGQLRRPSQPKGESGSQCRPVVHVKRHRTDVIAPRHEPVVPARNQAVKALDHAAVRCPDRCSETPRAAASLASSADGQPTLSGHRPVPRPARRSSRVLKRLSAPPTDPSRRRGSCEPALA